MKSIWNMLPLAGKHRLLMVDPMTKLTMAQMQPQQPLNKNQHANAHPISWDHGLTLRHGLRVSPATPGTN